MNIKDDEMIVQELECLQFFMHCTKDSDHVTKIMLMHGVLEEIQDHPTWHLVDGQWKTSKYVKPFSQHNKTKNGLRT